MEHARNPRLRPWILGLVLASCSSPWQAGWRSYERGEYERAIESWTPLAEEGHRDAQYLLGILHEEGRGVPADPTRAAEWYRRAAERGHPAAQNNLGVLHYEGMGTSRSHEDAARWYQLAADQGFPAAQSNLAVMHLFGQGVPYDPVRAEGLLRQAADRGHDRARWILGALHGERVSARDDEVARTLMLPAAGARDSKLSLVPYAPEGRDQP